MVLLHTITGNTASRNQASNENVLEEDTDALFLLTCALLMTSSHIGRTIGMALGR